MSLPENRVMTERLLAAKAIVPSIQNKKNKMAAPSLIRGVLRG
jgi:hypothetical protein